MAQEIQITAQDGSGHFMGYLATPQNAQPRGVILVIQEIFGVNADVRAKCEGFAAKGYLALAPDLFWRQSPGIELTDQSEAEWQKAFSLYQGFDIDKGVADLDATLAAARALRGGKVGAVGYCLGGLLAYLMVCRTNVDASVGYYGVGIEGHLAQAPAIKKPLLLHIAGADKFVDAAAQKALHNALDNHGAVHLYDYPGLEHAFARLGGTHYDAYGAQLADARTEGFFAASLMQCA
jgi:carboxymethylenebutenolidase